MEFNPETLKFINHYKSLIIINNQLHNISLCYINPI